MSKQTTLTISYSPKRNEGGGANLEHIFSNKDRYIDDLIREKNHYHQDPYDRERVAAMDAIANALTWSFQERGHTKLPKFYQTDQIDAEEIIPEMRPILQMVKYSQWASVMKTLAQVHGWSLMVMRTDENGQLDYDIYSEYQIPPANVLRDANNRVIGWRVQWRHRLPLDRHRTNITVKYETIMRGQPGVFYLTRGDEKSSWGFGYSIFEKTWDSITKLREESHANALRARVFPISIVPSNWSTPQTQEYFNAISKMDQTTALVAKAGKDTQGNMYPELPNFQWISPGTSASNKSTQGGSSAISDLSSEWARLCTATMHNVAYFFGAGTVSASKAAGGVDMYDDIETDIEEWNMMREFDVEVVQFLAEIASITVPDVFVVKSHWEWTRDEMMEQQTEMEQQQMDQTEDNAKASGKENVSAHAWSNYISMSPYDVESILMAMDGPTLRRDFNVKGRTQKELVAAIMTDIRRTLASSYMGASRAQMDESFRKFPTQKQWLDYHPKWNEEYQNQFYANALPNMWLPVNSSSGNVSAVGYNMGDANTIPTIFVKFGEDTYSYQDTDITDPAKTVAEIQMTGGNAIWEDLRASQSERSQHKPGQHPKGGAKTGTGQFVYAGKAHMRDYTKITGDPFGPMGGGSSAPLGPQGTVQTPGTPQTPTTTPESPEAFVDEGEEIQQLDTQEAQTASAPTTGGISVPTASAPTGAKAAAKPSAGKSATPSAKPKSTGGKGGASVKFAPLIKLGTPKPPEDLIFEHVNKKHTLSLTDMSPKRINELAAEKLNHTFGKGTIDLFKQLISLENELQSEGFRYNSVEVGKAMDFSIPLFYKNKAGTGYDVEYACRKDWREYLKNEQTTPLWLYHDHLEQIGTAKFTWNNESDEPFIEADYDRAHVMQLLEKHNKTDARLYKLLTEGKPAPLSTEYFASITKQNGKAFQTHMRELAVALVDQGNCPDNLCAFQPH